MKHARYFSLIVVVIVVTFIAGLTWSYVSASDGEQIIKVTAKKFEYSPKEITLKKGVPVVLEFTSLDRMHGFSCPGLGIRSDIPPEKVTRLQFVPQKAGTFPFHCDVFCGTGHGGMTGTIIVTE
ncbi:MAG TPA: cupredoxin domain-containing protein [Syntrophobacteria bacterium]|nr:cupredoxin domain-containing protein [Syntrophobacteria bacterium]